MIDTQETDKDNKCSTSTAIYHDSRKCYTKIMQEADKAKKCWVNTNTISKFKTKDKPKDIDNESNKINYFLPAQAKIMMSELLLK